MKRAPPIDVRHRAWECAWELYNQDLPSQECRAHVTLVRDMHPENLGWLSVVRMFVLYRDVLGERI